MVLIDQMAEPLLAEPSQGPYVVCALQECRRMNVLLGVITKSLSDLEKGLAGTLNMTQAIEDLIAALTISEWPGRNPYSQCAWEKFSWPSKKSLLPQYADMIKRHGQLRVDRDAGDADQCLAVGFIQSDGVPYMSILQVTARATGSALDAMTQETHMTVYKDAGAIPPDATFPENGAFIHGFFIEGARWPFRRRSGRTV